jgi:PAS domain S-box-containing protein
MGAGSSGFRAYIVAVSLPALALTAQYIIYSRLGGTPSPFLLIYPTVFFICWIGGLWPGLVATLLSALGAWYLFLPPHFSFGLPPLADGLKLAVFTVTGILFSVFVSASQDALTRLDQDFISILENTSDFVYFKDKESRIRFCSQTMATICGFHDWREMIGKHDREIFPEETARIYSEGERPVFDEGKPLLNKVDPYFDAEGHRRWVSTNKWPVFSHDRKTVVGIFGISRDITESKATQEAMERQARKTEILLRSANDGIHILDANGYVLQANDAFCRMLGYTQEEASRLNVTEWDAQWSSEELKNEVLPTLLEEPKVFETKHRRRDGRIIDVEISVIGVEIDGERMLFAASRDITERKRMQEELRIREATVERILLGAPVGIAKVTNRRITLANDHFCETVGYTRKEVVGMPTRAFYLSDEDYERTGRMFYTGAQERGKTAAEVTFRRKDVRAIDILLTMTPMDPDNPQAGATFMVMDISERKRALEALKRSAAELAESNRLKDIFTDVLRHDILNPLFGIDMAARLLETRESDPQKAKVLQSIHRSISGLREMTENASKLAKVAATQNMECALSDLNKMLRDLLHDFGSASREKDVAIELVTAEEAHADVNPIVRDVFSNLISNAIKYGSAHSRIEIDIDDRADSWVVSVKDQGDGISDENKERIFNRFERIGNQGVNGSGLGLTIARQIVSMHRGRIWVDDNPTGGCIFRVQLPKKEGSEIAESPAAH